MIYNNLKKNNMRFLYRLLAFSLIFILPIYIVLVLFLFLLYFLCGTPVFLFVYLFTGKIYDMDFKIAKMIEVYLDTIYYYIKKGERKC